MSRAAVTFAGPSRQQCLNTVPPTASTCVCVFVILCVYVVSVCVVVKAAALVGMPRLIFFSSSVTHKFGVR